jgi:hypothetical protein
MLYLHNFKNQNYGSKLEFIPDVTGAKRRNK